MHVALTTEQQELQRELRTYFSNLMTPEVKATILQRNPVPKSAPVGRQVSLRACEMQAEALVYVRDREVTDEAVQAELQPLLAQLHREGVTITGRMA